MESAICSRGLLKEFSPGNSIEQSCVRFFAFSRCPRSKETAGSCRAPLPPIFPPSFPMVQMFLKRCSSVMLAGCNPFQPSMWEDERDRAAEGVGGGVVLKVVLRWELVGKFSLPHLEKSGWVPLLHHTRFPFLASFRGRQSSFLFLSLFVTLFWGSFSTALRVWRPWPQASRDRGLGAYSIFLPWEVKLGIVQRWFFSFSFFLNYFPQWGCHFFLFFLNQGKHLKPCFSKAVFFIQLFGSYSTVPSALYLLLKSSDDCVSHSLSEEPQDNGD